MSGRMEFRIEELLGLGAPCGHLERVEIERLVDGRLESPRLAELEAHAASCSECAELIDDVERFRSLLVSGLTIPSEQRAFLESDVAVRERLGLARAPRRWLRSLFYWLTPSVALATLLLVWMWPSDPQRIVTVERVPLKPPPAVRGYALGQVWEQLEQPWGLDDMQQAVAILERAVRDHPGRSDLLFYLGVARLRSGDAAQALRALERADALQSDAPSEHTRWMLAAALERSDRFAEACEMLRHVVDLDGGRAEAAREIVDRSCR